MSAAKEARIIARLAAPIALSQLGLVAMSLVDTAILGHAGAEELAGGAIGRNIGFAAATIQIGIALAVEPLASQAVGAGKLRRAWNSLVATLRTLAILWIPTSLLAFALTLTLEPVGTDHAIAEKARLFLIGQTPGLLFHGLFLATKSYVQAHGRSLPIVIASATANVVNLVVCNLLVRGDDALTAVGLHGVGLPKLGALGAGMAVSIGGLVLVSIVLYSASQLRDRGPDEAGDAVSQREVLRLGLPVALHMAAEIGVFAGVSVLTGALGKSVVAAHQIALGLASFTFMGALGVSGATASRVGRAVGAKEDPRTPGLVGIGLGMCVMALGATAFVCAPGALVGLFTTDSEVKRVGVQLLALAAFFQLFDGVQAVASGALRGMGDVRFSFIAGACCYWLIGFPIAILLGFTAHMGAFGLWIGLTAGLVAAAIALGTRFIVVSGKRSRALRDAAREDAIVPLAEASADAAE
ncbi:NorM family multidrug efflux MATE transporter [soil metagenome]